MRRGSLVAFVWGDLVLPQLHYAAQVFQVKIPYVDGNCLAGSRDTTGQIKAMKEVVLSVGPEASTVAGVPLEVENTYHDPSIFIEFHAAFCRLGREERNLSIGAKKAVEFILFGSVKYSASQVNHLPWFW